MPFVTDIAGPQRPVQTWPPLVVGALRRTSTIDTHPAGTGDSDVDLRARDVVGRGTGAVDVLGEVRCPRAPRRTRHRRHRAIRTTSRLAQLPGSRVGPGFRSTVGKLLPDEVARAGLLHLLLDDWVGAALVSGYAVQHAAIMLGGRGEAARRHRRQHGGYLRGVRAGRLARPVRQAQRHHSVGARTGCAAARHRRRCTASNRCARTVCAGSAGWTSGPSTDRLRRALPRLARRR